MVREDGKRNFALRKDGAETSVFSGATPRQAALKAARRLEPAGRNKDDAQANATEIKVREKGTDKVHVYKAWVWKEDTPSNKPDWMPDKVTESNVSKQGIEHLNE